MEKMGFRWGSFSLLASSPLTSNFNDDPEYKEIIARGWQSKFEQMNKLKKRQAELELKTDLSK